MKTMVFPLIASLIFVFINLYSYKRFFKKISIFSSEKWYVVVFMISVLEVFYFFNLRMQFLNQTVQNFAALLIGISFIVFSYAVIYDGFYIFVKTIKLDVSRQKRIKSIFNASFIILIFASIVIGMINALHKPTIKNIDITLPNLKENLTLVQISDIHIGDFLDSEFLKEVVDSINTLNPDIVVITGDLIDIDPNLIEQKLSSLNDIKSKFGTYFVAGNHEYYMGIEKSLKNLGKLRLNILENKSFDVGGINIVGVNDFSGYRYGFYEPDFNKAIKDINKQKPTILLSHQPKIIEKLSDEDLSKVDLVLCGHTHAGQIFPFGILVKIVHKYLYGMYQKNNTKIYVTSGTGFWGPPIRFLTSSEIVKFNLKGK